MPFPLKSLGFYLVKKDFASARGTSGNQFKKGQLIQYQKTISDIHGMMEIISFLDWNTKARLIWHVDANELDEYWQDYLEHTKLG